MKSLQTRKMQPSVQNKGAFKRTRRRTVFIYRESFYPGSYSGLLMQMKDAKLFSSDWLMLVEFWLQMQDTVYWLIQAAQTGIGSYESPKVRWGVGVFPEHRVCVWPPVTKWLLGSILNLGPFSHLGSILKDWLFQGSYILLPSKWWFQTRLAESSLYC